MQSSATVAKTATTTWFSTETNTPGSNPPTRYKLTESYPIDPAQPPIQEVIDAVLDMSEPPGGQTTLTLYEHIDPDALADLLDASKDKQSHVEVRFQVDGYLFVVRSTNTILVYEPL
ncbi:HalOD1 output domain-containing protein [Halomicrococcus sp. NG-SE-24]|uniref:HalOD1 output domain-containing protein n=1 Tax=Halomicrococcus sp. NG-SE-24 TaxID=3436928 RepID=UPI003D95A5DF